MRGNSIQTSQDHSASNSMKACKARNHMETAGNGHILLVFHGQRASKKLSKPFKAPRLEAIPAGPAAGRPLLKHLKTSRSRLAVDMRHMGAASKGSSKVNRRLDLLWIFYGFWTILGCRGPKTSPNGLRKMIETLRLWLLPPTVSSGGGGGASSGVSCRPSSLLKGLIESKSA